MTKANRYSRLSCLKQLLINVIIYNSYNFYFVLTALKNSKNGIR